MPTPALPSPPVPAAVYARVSTLKQGEDWHTSLQVQVAECLAYAERTGYSVDPLLTVQEPYTGTTLDRPAFERLLADMVRQGVRHLIMDKPDRVTREGQVVAAYFIHRLQDIGVTLHLALPNFTVQDDISVSVFLNYAFAAKLENTQRVANVQRTRREAARSLGRYVKGNRPPYGWQLEPVELDRHGRPITYRLVHDPETYPLLLRILHARQAGTSYRRIASGLTADGVPTSAAYAGLRNADPSKQWHQSSVKTIVRDPINAGIVTGFRSHTVEAPPDARHPRRWYRQVPVPPSEHVTLSGDLVVDPPLSLAEYQWLLSPAAYALRSDGAARAVPQGGSLGGPRGRPKAADLAVGHGGLYRHAACGGTVRVNIAGSGTSYSYYACQRHNDVPERCPGFTVAAPVLDALVWEAVVRRVLLVPGKLEALAEQQRQADSAGEDPDSEVRRWGRVRTGLLDDQESLMDSVKHARSAYVRRLAEKELADLEPKLADADEHLADAQRRHANEEQRRAILADVQAQVGRYALVLQFADLLPTAERVVTQRRVLRALGFRATVDKHLSGQLEVAVELRLSAGQPGLWFTPEEGEQMMQVAQREGLTGLLGVEAGVIPEVPFSDEALRDFLKRAAAHLPTLQTQPMAAEQPEDVGRSDGTTYTTTVGRVRFVTATSSSCP